MRLSLECGLPTVAGRGRFDPIKTKKRRPDTPRLAKRSAMAAAGDLEQIRSNTPIYLWGSEFDRAI